MALSNIFNEPRRELTETAVGLVPAAAFGGAVYWVAVQLWKLDNETPPPLPFVTDLVVGCLIVAVALVSVFVVALLVHAAGESICGALERRGVRLRQWWGEGQGPVSPAADSTYFDEKQQRFVVNAQPIEVSEIEAFRAKAEAALRDLQESGGMRWTSANRSSVGR